MTRQEGLKLISKSAIYGNLGLFIGAGMSMAILNSEWETVALSWKELIHKCAAEFKIDLKNEIKTEGLSYPEIASELAKLVAANEEIDYQTAIYKLKEKIAVLTCWYPEKDARNDYGKILENIDPAWIITTNYDLIIECLLTGKSISLEPSEQLVSPQNLIPIYHLHGIRTNPRSIIISQEDYISLFRPNQYRQQKLSLSIKESTTLIIGYGLGDVNVLTAVDWCKNVYSEQRISYPHDIIQLLYTDNPAPNPYRDRNDILIIEFNNLKSILSEIAELINSESVLRDEQEIKLQKLNAILQNPTEEDVKKFIDDEDFRKGIIENIAENGVSLISGFMELFSKAVDETWVRAEPKGAFSAYKENLDLILDILEKIELSNIPPALFEALAYNLDKVAYYVGTSYGESRAAHRLWISRKDNIPKATMQELKYLAKSRNYYKIKNLFRK